MVRKIGILSDVHHPYCDRKAYNLAIGIFLKIGIDELVLNGDFADFFGINSHGDNLEVEEKFHEEIDLVIHELSQLKQLFPNAKKIFIEGNHSRRLARYITNEAPKLDKIITLEKLLFLKSFDFELIPYGPNQKYKVGTLNIRHEPLGGGENHSNTSLKKGGCNVLYGHHHTIQEHQAVSFDGSYHRAISVGCLCDKNHPVMSYVKHHHNWQLGFAIITLLDDNKTWFCQNVHIIPGDKYRCMVNGKIYEI